ncbi:MAG: hypothetical protein WAN81_19270 [Candidatus Binataceae bacterium]
MRSGVGHDPGAAFEADGRALAQDFRLGNIDDSGFDLRANRTFERNTRDYRMDRLKVDPGVDFLQIAAASLNNR